MKKTMISALALAAALAGGAAIAQNAAAPTKADAEAFVADAEKQLAEFGVDAARVAWVNTPYITDDTDALSAKYGTIGTEMSEVSPTWRVPLNAASSGVSPVSMPRCAFSSTTIESSTTRPIDSASASSVTRLIE